MVRHSCPDLASNGRPQPEEIAVPTRAKRAPRTRPLTTYHRTAPGDIPLRALGKTGEYVSAIRLGGFHIGLTPTEREATRIVHEAIDAGITFMDNAWEYHDGKSEHRVGKA